MSGFLFSAKVSQYMSLEKGESFQVRDLRGRPVETWYCVSIKRGDSGHGDAVFEIDGYRDVSAI